MFIVSLDCTSTGVSDGGFVSIVLLGAPVMVSGIFSVTLKVLTFVSSSGVQVEGVMSAACVLSDVDRSGTEFA